MFIGKLNEDSLPLLFRSEPLQRDKDADFGLLKTDRADLCSVLLKAGKIAQEALSSEIFEALANLSKNKDLFWSQDSEIPRLLEEGRELVKRMQEVETELRKMVDELYPNFPGFNTLDVAKNLSNYYRIQLARKPDAIPLSTMNRLVEAIQNFEKTKGAADAFCKSDHLFQSYVKDGLGKRMGLGCQSALFFAQEKGINLRIWRPVSEKNNLLVPEGSSRRIFDPSLPITDLLWHEDKSHFESLSVIQPTSSPNILQPSSSQRTPASSQSTAVRAVYIVGDVEGAPSLLIRNLSYRLLFSPLVLERRYAARHLAAAFKYPEFLTNILLIALRESDPVVFHLADKMLGQLGFDRHQQKEPISFLITYAEYSINMDQRRIMIHSIAKGECINLKQLHKPINPDFVDERPQISDSPLPHLHDYSPHIIDNVRQKGEGGVTLTAGFKLGGATFNIGGRTTGAFDNRAGNVPRQVSDSVSAQPPAVNNPSETRSNNFISSVTNFLKEINPDNKTKLATIVRIIWPRVRDDSASIKHARDLYAGLAPDIKERLKNLYPDIHELLSKSAIPHGDKMTT